MDSILMRFKKKNRLKLSISINHVVEELILREPFVVRFPYSILVIRILQNKIQELYQYCYDYVKLMIIIVMMHNATIREKSSQEVQHEMLTFLNLITNIRLNLKIWTNVYFTLICGILITIAGGKESLKENTK